MVFSVTGCALAFRDRADWVDLDEDDDDEDDEDDGYEYGYDADEQEELIRRINTSMKSQSFVAPQPDAHRRRQSDGEPHTRRQPAAAARPDLHP